MRADFKELEQLIKALSPSERKKLARKVGMTMRRNATQKIKRNIDPEGDAFEPRKPQKYSRKSGKMFKQLSKANRLKLTASPNSVVMTYKSGLDKRIADVHQSGKRSKVNKYTLVKYPVRELFGFAEKDNAALAEAIKTHLGF